VAVGSQKWKNGDNTELQYVKTEGVGDGGLLSMIQAKKDLIPETRIPGAGKTSVEKKKNLRG